MLSDSPTPGHCRSAANRAYYGAYGTLRQKIVTTLNSDCFVVNGNPSGRHSALVRTCTRHRDASVRWIGKMLESLLILREQADYEWGVDVPTEKVKTAVITANKTVARIKMLGANELRAIHDSLGAR